MFFLLKYTKSSKIRSRGAVPPYCTSIMAFWWKSIRNAELKHIKNHKEQWLSLHSSLHKNKKGLDKKQTKKHADSRLSKIIIYLSAYLSNVHHKNTSTLLASRQEKENDSALLIYAYTLVTLKKTEYDTSILLWGATRAPVVSSAHKRHVAIYIWW